MYSYISKGRYNEQIKKYEKEFGIENIKLVKSRRLFNDTEEVYREVCDFLGIGKKLNINFEKKNKGGNKREVSSSGKKFVREKLSTDASNLRKNYGISF